MTNALINYDSACRAIAMAAKVDEVLNIRDQAEAMRAYARQAQNKDLEAYALEIRLRAERKLGQVIIEQKESGALAKPGRPKKVTPEVPFSDGNINVPAQEHFSEPTKLEEIGVSRKLSSRAQKLAALPAHEFNAHIEEHKQQIAAVNAKTVNKLEKAGEKAIQKHQDVDALLRENETLREQIDELADNLKETQEDNESMAKVFAADDKLAAAISEAKKLRDLNRVLEVRNRSLMNEKADAQREARKWKHIAEKAEKELAKLKAEGIPS